MNLDDLAVIERAAGLRLADDLRTLYLRYPFSPGSWAQDCAMPNDVSLLLDMNGSSRVRNATALSGRKVLQIGSDGGESVFFAESDGATTRILEFDLETGALTLRWNDLDAWAAHIEDVDRELSEDEHRMGRRPWWKFWG